MYIVFVLHNDVDIYNSNKSARLEWIDNIHAHVWTDLSDYIYPQHHLNKLLDMPWAA